jgi:transcriptional regulator with XRE-family HTH domain
MRSIKQTRQILGLSQQQMAIYLDVTRTLLSMAEQGRRSLPTAAVLKLAMLETSLQCNVQYRAASFQKQAAKDTAHIRAHAKKCLQRAALEKAKLQKLTAGYQQCVQALMAIGYLLQKQPTKKEGLLLAVLEAKALKKMDRCGYTAQVVLQLRIAALEHEAVHAGRIKF